MMQSAVKLTIPRSAPTLSKKLKISCCWVIYHLIYDLRPPHNAQLSFF